MARVTERGYDSEGLNWGTAMRNLFAAAALLLLAGCETPGHFLPGEATGAQFARDQAGCQLEAEKIRAAATVDRPGAYVRGYDACMRSKGYAVATSS
jgi:hypothetical protein